MSWQENIAQFHLPACSVKSSCSSKPLSFQNDGGHRADPVWLTVCPSRFCHTGSWSGYQEMLELIPADTREREPKYGRQPGQSRVCHPVSNWWKLGLRRSTDIWHGFWNNTWSKNGPFGPTVETLALTLLEHVQQNANLAIEEWIWLQTQPGPSWQVATVTFHIEGCHPRGVGRDLLSFYCISTSKFLKSPCEWVTVDPNMTTVACEFPWCANYLTRLTDWDWALPCEKAPNSFPQDEEIRAGETLNNKEGPRQSGAPKTRQNVIGTVFVQQFEMLP